MGGLQEQGKTGPSKEDQNSSANAFEGALAAAFRQATNSLTVTSPSGDFLEVNQAFSSLIGYERQDLLKMNMRDLLHPDDHHLHEVLLSATNRDHANFDL